LACAATVGDPAGFAATAAGAAVGVAPGAAPAVAAACGAGVAVTTTTMGDGGGAVTTTGGAVTTTTTGVDGAPPRLPQPAISSIAPSVSTRRAALEPFVLPIMARTSR
jgi:hypothetical protein